MRIALPPFVNEFEAWMPPETRCVRALCPKRGAMARVWLGREGGRGWARAATTRVRHDERARKSGGTDVDSSAKSEGHSLASDFNHFIISLGRVVSHHQPVV